MLHVLRTVSLCAIAIALMATGKAPTVNAPVIVVYPLTAYGDGNAPAGQRIATLIGRELEEAGSVERREPPPRVLREDYLETARKAGADYYLSGFVTVVSGEQSVMEQLVSTLSGTVVWSHSSRLVTDDDARAQGDLVQAAVIGHAGRALSSFRYAPIVSAAKTGPRDSGPVPKAEPPAPKAEPTPPGPAPSSSVKPSVVVLRMGGSASADGKAYAGAAIVAALLGRGFDAVPSDEPADDLPILGPTLCASTGAALLLGGTLAIATQQDHEIGPWSTAKIDLTGYDCVKDRDLGVKSSTAGSYAWRWAVDQATGTTLRPILLSRASI